jgi:hypothetical protein
MTRAVPGSGGKSGAFPPVAECKHRDRFTNQPGDSHISYELRQGPLRHLAADIRNSRPWP